MIRFNKFLKASYFTTAIGLKNKKIKELSAVGFEPTPTNRSGPKPDALDHSAKQTRCTKQRDCDLRLLSECRWWRLEIIGIYTRYLISMPIALLQGQSTANGSTASASPFLTVQYTWRMPSWYITLLLIFVDLRNVFAEHCSYERY